MLTSVGQLLHDHRSWVHREKKRCCSKAEAFEHCEIDSGFCMSRIHPVEFMLKSELRESSPTPDSFKNRISYFVLNFSRVFQS